jgi:hypothetical protein
MAALVAGNLAARPAGGTVVAVRAATPAGAPYDNALVAKTALRYVGRWGGEACADAHRSGETASTNVYPTYPAGTSAANPPRVGAKINPANGGDGQCRSFVNCILWLASGKTQWVGLAPTDYFYAFTHPSGGGSPGVEITDVSQLAEGDIVQQGVDANAANLHTFIVVKPLGSGSFDVVDSNYKHDEYVSEHPITVSLGATERAFRMGSQHTTASPSLAGSILFVQDEPFTPTIAGKKLTVWFGNTIWAVKSDGSGLRQIYTVGPTTAAVAPKDEVEFPRASADGHRVFFVSHANRHAIRQVAADGSGARFLPATAYQQWADPSPDGKQIALVGFRDGSGSVRWQVRVQNLDGTQRRVLASGPDPQMIAWTPLWLPDGSVLFSENGKVYRVAGGSSTLVELKVVEQALPANPGELYDVSADGRWLLFGFPPSPFSRPNRFLVLRSDGSGLHTVHASGAQPALSPDGRSIVYAGTAGLMVVPVDGSSSPRLLWRGHVEGPSWP